MQIHFRWLKETYEPKIASQKISYLMLAFAITSGLSVALGGTLKHYFGWMIGIILGLLSSPWLAKRFTLRKNYAYLKNVSLS